MQNLPHFVIARFDEVKSWQFKTKSNPCEAPKTRPLCGAKNREQASSSASADFLLEADKRGTPPKSEKAAAFWRVGGAGRGVQPFLRKDSSESKNQNDENLADSANCVKIAESNKNNESITQKQINADSLQVSNSSKMQILPNGLPRFCFAESRNDGE
ncbi:hypothetical protein ACWIUD_01380 [Helicobacter sp. 23-1044]